MLITVLVVWSVRSWNVVNLESTADTQNVYSDSIEIALIFIGCSFCPSANDKNLPKVIEDISNVVEAWALTNNVGYTTVGLSNETDINIGLEYLTSVYTFDEIALGNAMKNIALQEYVWNRFDSPNAGATPQVLISKRSFKPWEDGQEEIERIFPAIEKETILIRQIGLKDIQRLLENNFIEKVLGDLST